MSTTLGMMALVAWASFTVASRSSGNAGLVALFCLFLSILGAGLTLAMEVL